MNAATTKVIPLTTRAPIASTVPPARIGSAYSTADAISIVSARMMSVPKCATALLTLRSSGADDELAGASPFDVQREIAADYTVIPPLAEDRFLCSFGHIFAGG